MTNGHKWQMARARQMARTNSCKSNLHSFVFKWLLERFARYQRSDSLSYQEVLEGCVSEKIK